MKTTIILIIGLGISLLLKSQSFQILSDTNVIFNDYIPDINLTNPSTDSLLIDINQDGISDIQFYIVFSSTQNWTYIKSLNNNINYAFIWLSLNTDSLASNSLTWNSVAKWWNPIDCPEKIGVRFSIEDFIYYGWIRVYHTPYTTNIDKYAFCKIANYPFLWGQTEIISGLPDVRQARNTNVFTYVTGNTLVVQSDKLIKGVKLIKISGIVVISQDNINSGIATIDKSVLAHGTYIVHGTFMDDEVFTIQVIL